MMLMFVMLIKIIKFVMLLIDEYVLLGWCVMLIEVNLLLKSGFVDCINCGVYKDMVLEDFYCSVLVIQGWLFCFIEFGVCSVEMVLEVVFYGLCLIGMVCEGDMFCVIVGVNMYKGSIFFLGLLCVVIGCLF